MGPRRAQAAMTIRSHVAITTFSDPCTQGRVDLALGGDAYGLAAAKLATQSSTGELSPPDLVGAALWILTGVNTRGRLTASLR